MKKKDLLTLVVVGIVSGVFAMILSNTFIGSDKNKNQTAEVVPVITGEFNPPPTEYFNSSSINPTQTIQIGTDASDQPFSGQ